MFSLGGSSLGSHLISFRTQKLSQAEVKILFLGEDSLPPGLSM